MSEMTYTDEDGYVTEVAIYESDGHCRLHVADAEDGEIQGTADIDLTAYQACLVAAMLIEVATEMESSGDQRYIDD